MTHWIADSLTLWKSPLTDAHLFTAAAYYSLLSKMNVYMAATTVGIVTVGFMGLVLSFQDGEAGNLMFDGASICESILFINYYHVLTLPFTSPVRHLSRSLRVLSRSQTVQIHKLQHSKQCSTLPLGFTSTDDRARLIPLDMCSSTHRRHHSSSGEILGRWRR